VPTSNVPLNAVVKVESLEAYTAHVGWVAQSPATVDGEVV